LLHPYRRPVPIMDWQWDLHLQRPNTSLNEHRATINPTMHDPPLSQDSSCLFLFSARGKHDSGIEEGDGLGSLLTVKTRAEATLQLMRLWMVGRTKYYEISLDHHQATNWHPPVSNKTRQPAGFLFYISLYQGSMESSWRLPTRNHWLGRYQTFLEQSLRKSGPILERLLGQYR